MIILEDSRQKPEKNKHIKSQLEALGYTVVRNKLLVGDYAWPTDQHICVDTKVGLQEVASNLTQDHERFKRECILAKECGIQLVVLVQEPNIKDLSAVLGWWNPRLRYSKKAITGNKLGKIMYVMRDKYGVQWEFTTKEHCGESIVKLLGGKNESLL